MPNVFYFRDVILTGTLENGTRNSGTPEQHGTPPKKQEHPQENPEHLRRAGKVQNLKEIKLN